MNTNGHDTSRTAARRVSGLKAKRMGDSFEQLFEWTCSRHKVKATRFPNGCKRVGPKRLVQVPTPFDWILSFGGKSAMIDTKTDSRNFPHSKIKNHQVKEMLEHELHGVLAGYVIWLRDVDQVVFMTASFLVDRMNTRGSITHETRGVIPLGSIEDLDPSKIFGRFGIVAWMRKEIEDGPKDS